MNVRQGKNSKNQKKVEFEKDELTNSVLLSKM